MKKRSSTNNSLLCPYYRGLWEQSGFIFPGLTAVVHGSFSLCIGSNFRFKWKILDFYSAVRRVASSEYFCHCNCNDLSLLCFCRKKKNIRWWKFHQVARPQAVEEPWITLDGCGQLQMAIDSHRLSQMAFDSCRWLNTAMDGCRHVPGYPWICLRACPRWALDIFKGLSKVNLGHVQGLSKASFGHVQGLVQG